MIFQFNPSCSLEGDRLDELSPKSIHEPLLFRCANTRRVLCGYEFYAFVWVIIMMTAAFREKAAVLGDDPGYGVRIID
jgi:hypothetical protein